jgi:exosortase A
VATFRLGQMQMSTPGFAQPLAAAPWRGLRVAVSGIAVGLVILGLVFHREIAAAVRVWIASTAYNHCFLVIPIAAYLLWDRRDTLRGLTPYPAPVFALAGIPLALAWLAADRMGMMEGRQLVALTFVELLFLVVLGWRSWWAMSGPLLYLYFLVPFGEFLVPKLQVITTGFIQLGVDVLGIPAYIDGFTIEIPEGTFYVAEACAGLRFLIASVAFGCLYSLLMYRTPLRRSLFILASLIVPVIANGLRALGIVALGHMLGSAQAAAADHVLYGWIFFSLVIMLLIALGLPLRQDQREATPPVRAEPVPATREFPTLRRAAIAGAAVCICAAISPAVAMRLDAGANQVRAATLPALDFGPSCTTDGPGHMTCDGLPLRVQTLVLSSHSTAAPVFAAERRAINQTDDGEVRIAWVPAASGALHQWRVVHYDGNGPVMAISLWIDGRPTQPSMKERLRLAWSSVAGAQVPPVLIAVTPELDWAHLSAASHHMLEDRLVRLLQHQPDLAPQIRRIAAGRGH